MILAALDDRMIGPLERFGTAPTRIEAQVSCSSNPQRPDDQFFETLAEFFNDHGSGLCNYVELIDTIFTDVEGVD
jgi:hypothetical protein